MKKFFISFLVIFLALVNFFSTNIVLAQKIVCKVEPKKYAVRLFLLKYDDNDIEEGYVWGYIFRENINLLDDYISGGGSIQDR